MSYLDLAPYRRTSVGFDRLFDMMNGAAVDPDAFPSYDIVREDEGSYSITIAVPGFQRDELEIVAEQNLLTVSGRRPARARDGLNPVFKGISTPDSFERRFQLADFVRVEEARLENGLLTLTLKRELPDALRPHSIKINHGQSQPEEKAPAEKAEA
jgi:molecular chaperone IbpA